MTGLSILTVSPMCQIFIKKSQKAESKRICWDFLEL